MADEAAKLLLRAAGPGHFDVVAENIQKLGQQSLSKSGGAWLTQVRDEQDKFKCISIGEQQQQDHPLAGPLTEKIKQYQQSNFAGKQGVTTRVAVTSGSGGDELVVHTFAEKMDGPNQISGYWKATWTIGNIKLGAGDMSGRVQLHSCAYEEGNSHLVVDKEFPSTEVVEVSLKKGEKPTFEQGVMKQIMEWEMEILDLLATMNESGTAEHLKSIRRVLPITKTKMKWDVVAQRSVKTLKMTAPQAKSKVNYGL